MYELLLQIADGLASHKINAVVQRSADTRDCHRISVNIRDGSHLGAFECCEIRAFPFHATLPRLRLSDSTVPYAALHVVKGKKWRTI
jgi:hypothetical protein